MVGVRVRDDDLRDALSGLERVDDRVDVLGHVGARIDDRDISAADDVRARTEIRELARVVGDDPTDERRHLINVPVLDLEVAYERDACRQTCSLQTLRPRNAMSCVCSSAPDGASTLGPNRFGWRSIASSGFTFS